MSLSSAESQSSRVERQRAARPGLIRGLIIGMLMALTLVLLVWIAKGAITSGPRTFQTMCNGASVTGTIWVDDDSQVRTSVAVLDPGGRSWEVAWGNYADEVASSTMSTTPGSYYEGTQLSAAQSLTDTDDGTHRTAQVRPAGQRAWCDLDMHVSWVW